MVAEFHAALGEGPPDAPTVGTEELRELRATLLAEECAEAVESLESGDLHGLAKELADVLYVAYGAAYSHGIDLDAVTAEVHASNMSKLTPCDACQGNGRGPYWTGTCGDCLGTGRTPERRPGDGKVLKGPDYRPPDIEGVLFDAAV